MKRAIVSVTNNLKSDKRVNKTAQTLKELGFDVTLVGRYFGEELKVKSQQGNGKPETEFNIKRFRLIFNKGPLFYSEYNIRLFFYLIFHKSDLLIANDLDTLPANYLAQRVKRNGHGEPGLIYDCHEYFTGVPE